jgi:hypothetical protein
MYCHHYLKLASSIEKKFVNCRYLHYKHDQLKIIGKIIKRGIKYKTIANIIRLFIIVL